jgi:D-cysteine desulfhydrase family pyridoxal phosphate-dependent enzyme
VNELPRAAIAHLPTPLEELPRLSQELGGPRLLVKRDDQTGLAFGGNKTRKLEYLVGEAIAEGADVLVTAGAVQSNHCRQTAAAAARFGFACKLVLFGDAGPRPTANLWLDQLLGAEIIYTTRARRDVELQNQFDAARQEGRRPYLVPYGGSNGTGAAAYAEAMREFLEQRVAADWIVFASSSGGTQAGLMAGARLHGFGGRVLGISVDEPQAALQAKVASLASEVAAKLGFPQTFSNEDALVNDQYCGAGYGVMTDGERAAIRLFARIEGLLLDPVYTGRAAAGLLDLIRRGFFPPDDTVLFWHTGGTPALFADAYSQSLL